MSEPRPVHASDLKQRRRCLRLPVLARQCERTPARGKAGSLGQRVHRAIELYVTTSTFPDERTAAGRVALELVPWVPADALGAEVPFRVQWQGVWFEGTIDLVTHGRVIDWKTTGEWKNALATLADDPQATIYSYAHAASGGAPDGPALSWIYVHTRSLQVRPLHGHVHPSRMSALAPEVFGLLEDEQRHGGDPLAIPGNRAECARFGGCEHLATCGAETNVSRFDRVTIGGAR